MNSCNSFKWLSGFFHRSEEIVSLIEVKCQLEGNHTGKHFAKWYKAPIKKNQPDTIHQEIWGDSK